MLNERVVLMVASGKAELEKGLCRQHSSSHRDTQDRMEKETPDSKCRHEEDCLIRNFTCVTEKLKGCIAVTSVPALYTVQKLPEPFTFRVTYEEFSDFLRNLSIDWTVTGEICAHVSLLQIGHCL